MSGNSLFTVWGSVIVGALLTFIGTIIYDRYQKVRTKKEILRILYIQLDSMIKTVFPDNSTNLPSWPDLGCTIIPVILQGNLINGRSEINLITELSKLHGLIQTYYSYRVILSNLIFGSFGFSPDSFNKNAATSYSTMLAHATIAVNQARIVQSILKKASYAKAAIQ